MRISVRHATIYRCDPPMRYVTQSHRLTPASSEAQTILAWEVAAEGAVFGAEFVDGAGDRLATMTIQGPVERIEVVASGVVETTDTAGVLRGHCETMPPQVYLRPTHWTAPNRAFFAMLEASRSGLDLENTLGLAHALSHAVEQAIAYRPGSTDAQSTAAEALERGEGVCQDHAHALITVARLAGMPARYVTGYLLRDGDGDGDQGEATHGWAEIHVEALGWIGFDAANACCPDDRYIRLGSGRDAIEAAPIRGISRGVGREAMEVSVSVAAQGQGQGQQQGQQQRQQ